MFADDITIEDTMQVQVEYANKTSLNYTLVAYSPWEGLEVKFHGTKGELTHRGRPVQPGSIRDIGLLTVEGENDDISGVGQTQAAHALCTGLSDDFKEDYVQPHVGHYGVFNGRRFREEIYPRVRAFIRRQEAGIEKNRDAA